MRLIDADALMNELMEVRLEYQMLDNTQRADIAMGGLRNAEKKVEEAPTVDAVPRWIPCEERLPDELEEVNVTWVNHKPEPYYDFVKDKPFTASAVYYKGDWYWYSSVCADLLAERGENEIDKIDGAIEITAWMPLPEPYMGERKDDE